MRRIARFLTALTLSQQFMIAGLVILLLGALGIGAWVEQQIVTGVIHRTGATTALYVDSFISPLLQGLGSASQLSPAATEELSHLLQNTPMGQQIAAFRVWDTRGRLMYSTDTASVGKTYPMTGGLLHARLGEVVSELSSLDKEENQALGVTYERLLETYSPVWLSGTDQVIGVAEFYQSPEALEQEIAVLKRQSWFVVGAAAALMYLMLAGFVRRASNTITRQQAEMRRQMAYNAELHERVRRAAGSVAMLNEGYLRRVGSELHDGPTQDLSLSLLKLDALIGRIEKHNAIQVGDETMKQLDEINSALQGAVKEMRTIASGLSLPQLTGLDMAETVVRVVRAHERRTGTRVALELGAVPGEASLPLKITTYRLIQEALNNAARHASGTGQRVRVACTEGALEVEISDSGPGFVVEQAGVQEGRLGLFGMRERVESLGGSFQVRSAPGQGATVLARLPCAPGGLVGIKVELAAGVLRAGGGGDV